MTASNKTGAFLRKGTGTQPLEKTLRKAVSVLAESGIPSLVVGGYAVQENGYARFTQDVDLVVPDVAAARERLSINGFRENPGSTMTLTDRQTKFEVDLLPGGGSVGPGPLPLPMPHVVSKTPTIIDLMTLIAIKLSSYLGNPVTRVKDYADVIELMKANAPARDAEVPEPVREAYQAAWDGLHGDSKKASLLDPLYRMTLQPA